MCRRRGALRVRGKSFDDPAVAERLAAALADIKHVRREGFNDRDREELAAAFAKVDEALISVRDEIERFTSAAVKPVKGRLPADRFPEDRAFFSAAFTEAYLGKEDPDDDEAG